MKTYRFLTLLFLTLVGTTLHAQTLNVNVGNVTYLHSAANVGDMTFGTNTAGSATLTIEGMTYTLSDVSSMEVADNSYDDNQVSVTYNGNTATVAMSGNLASKIGVSIDGANVRLVQEANATINAVSYVLSGTSSNGSFYMEGTHTAALTLNNLTLTSTNGATIDIQDGKKTNIYLQGSTTLADAANGTHNACFYVDGGGTISGDGSLTITGNTKHGFSADEALIIQEGTGTITVTNAVADGFHLSENLQMNGGTVSITAAGDGLDLGFRGVNKGTKDNYENNGFVFINGGTLTINSTGNAAKGLKCDSTCIVSGGSLDITVSGAAYYDATEADITSSSALKPGGDFNMTGGTISLKATGAGGKGLNADGNINISGGDMTIVTMGARYKYNSELDTKPQGMKCDGSISLTGGNVKVAVTDAKATACKTDVSLMINGASVFCIGGKSFAPSLGSQSYKTYSNQMFIGGNSYIMDGITFNLPTGYSNTAAFVLTSAAQ